jgi:putative FmdB family regulatory protein
MPIFEYSCENCGVFEMIVDSHDSDHKICCPNCLSESRRLFSPPSFYRPFSGMRHKVLNRAEKGRDPKVVRRGEGDPLESALPNSTPHRHVHHHGCGNGSPGYAPWMLKH